MTNVGAWRAMPRFTRSMIHDTGAMPRFTRSMIHDTGAMPRFTRSMFRVIGVMFRVTGAIPQKKIHTMPILKTTRK
jgi:hypothetical protein